MKLRIKMALLGIMACTSLIAENYSEWVITDNDEYYEEEGARVYYCRPPLCYHPVTEEDLLIEKREASHWPGKREGDLYEELTR